MLELPACYLPLPAGSLVQALPNAVVQRRAEHIQKRASIVGLEERTSSLGPGRVWKKGAISDEDSGQWGEGKWPQQEELTEEATCKRQPHSVTSSAQSPESPGSSRKCRCFSAGLAAWSVLLLLGEEPVVLLPQHETVTPTPAAGRSLVTGQHQVCAVCTHDTINHSTFSFLLNFVF